MRSKIKFARRMRNIFILVVIALLFYAFGFSHGQASVYEKAKNDAKFNEQVFGGEK